MIHDLWLIGIGTGSPAHVTLEGQQAMRDAAVILLPHKGAGKDDLAELRYRLIRDSGSTATVLPFDYPVRDPTLPYQDRVAAWHDEIARRWQEALHGDTPPGHANTPPGHANTPPGPVALLVWGDPSLYDSTLRIARRLAPPPAIRVIPGITAIQALTAAHAIPLNQINGPVEITTGRRLRGTGWPDGADTVVVLLDGKAQFLHLNMPNLYIWWGAYLGSPDEILAHGPLADTAQTIAKQRDAARRAHGWIMDTYLLRPMP